MAKTFDFIGDSANDLLTKYTPTIVGMGAGAGLVTAVRSTMGADQGMSMMTNVAVDLGLFVGAAWASSEFTRGMPGQFTNGLILAGSLSLINDVWTAVSPSGKGLMEYTESILAGTTSA